MVSCEDVPGDSRLFDQTHRRIHHRRRGIALVEEVSKLNYSFDSEVRLRPLYSVSNVSDQIPTTAVETSLHRTPELGGVPDVGVSEN